MMKGVSNKRGQFPTTVAARHNSETKRALLTPDEVMHIREDELLVKMAQKLAARLTQRRYDNDPEVKGRTPALDPRSARNAQATPWRPRSSTTRSTTTSRTIRTATRRWGGESADVTEEPDAKAADALFSVAVPDR